MKKTVIILLFLVASINMIAQTFRVQSMVELTHDLSARISPRLDASGRECALIRINIPSFKDATFNSPIVGTPNIEPGEFTVYIPTESNELQFECEGQSYKVDFSDYQISLQPKSSYRIVLLKDNYKKNTHSVSVMVSANYDNDILLLDGIPVGQLPVLLDDVSVGKHTFSVPNTQGRVQKDTIIIVSTQTDTINLLLKEEKKKIVQLEWDDYYAEGRDMGDYEPQWGVLRKTKNGKAGLVDYAGNVIIPFQYDNEYFIDEGGYYLVCQKSDGEDYSLNGIFIPGKGEILPCKYYSFGLYGDLCCCNGYGGVQQIYNIKTQQFVLSGNYYNIRVHDNKYFTAEDEQKNTLIIDVYGNHLLTIPHLHTNPPTANVSLDSKEGLAVSKGWTTRGDECRVYDLTGNSYLLPSQYEFLRLTNGLLAVRDKNTKKIGYLSENMREIIPVRYIKETHFLNDYDFSHGTILVETDENDTVIFNWHGDIIAQTVPNGINSYIHIEQLSCGKYLCKNMLGEQGVIDSMGSIIIPFTTDTIDYYEDFFAITNFEGKKKILDNNGNTILPWGNYKDYYVENNPYKILALTEENFLIYNDIGDCIVKIPVLQNAEINSSGNKTCEIRSGNNIIRRTKDDRIFQIVNVTTKKYGFISASGELLTSCIYDEITGMFDMKKITPDEDWELWFFSLKINSYTASEGYGIVCLGDRYGFVDSKGNVVVPLIYTAATPFINGEAFVRDQNNKWTKIYSRDLK